MAQQLPPPAGIQYDEYVYKKYSSIDIKNIATQALKRAINIGDAIVNVLGATGIAGFKFHIPEAEQVRLESEITDYYTDINTPIHNHIARKPLTITLTGGQGDFFYSIHEIEDMIARITPTLSIVKQFLPKITGASKQALVTKYDNIATASPVPINSYLTEPQNSSSSIINAIEGQGSSSAITDAIEGQGSSSAITNAIENKTTGPQSVKGRLQLNSMDLFELFQNLYKVKSAQTKAFLFFEALWKSEASFSIETTWKRYDDMVLQSVIPNRDNLADITEFQATFKQVLTVESKTESIENVAGRMKQQAASQVSHGEDKGEYIGDV